MQDLRRCREDKDDFTFEDSSAFPMQLMEGGNYYGFCPAKVTWGEPESVNIYNMLVISAETGNLLGVGGIEDQEAWFIELLAWFVPYYDELKFIRRAKMILGDNNDKKSQVLNKANKHGNK